MPIWPTAILFDFDGVIVNSEHLHFAGFQQTLSREQIVLTEEEYFRELIGFDDKGAFRHLYQKHGRELDANTFFRLMAGKSEAMTKVIHEGRFEALPGVKELVRGLSKNYPLAICSGALREEIEPMLDGIGLRDCFPTIVAAEDVSIGKPDPLGYLLTMNLLQERAGQKLEPSDCLIVEDAPSVIRSVRAAGFSVLAVTNSYPAEKLRDANYIVNQLTPAEVFKTIPQLKLTI